MGIGIGDVVSGAVKIGAGFATGGPPGAALAAGQVALGHLTDSEKADANEQINRLNRVREKRERISQIREARIQRAQIRNQAAATGTTGSSSAVLGVESVASQLEGNLDFLSTVSDVQEKIQEKTGKAQNFASLAQGLGGLSDQFQQYQQSQTIGEALPGVDSVSSGTIFDLLGTDTTTLQPIETSTLPGLR